MKNVTFLFLLFYTLTCLSQKKDIKFKTEKSGKSITFICLNSSNTDQEVTLYFPKIKGLKGYDKPIKKVVPANDKLTFTTLTINGAYSYSSSYNYKAYFSEDDEAKFAEKLKDKQLKEISELNKGIVVFSKKGCSRCKYTNNFLIKNNIEYSYINTTNNKKNNQLMWSILKEKKVKSTNVLMPVILVDGELFSDFKNLKGFLTSLKNKQ